MYFDILFDIFSAILSGIFFLILSGILSSIFFDIFSGILGRRLWSDNNHNDREFVGQYPVISLEIGGFSNKVQQCPQRSGARRLRSSSAHNHQELVG